MRNNAGSQNFSFYKAWLYFKSSGNSDCLVASNKDNYSKPSFGNLGDGRFTGSELFIDDIRLNY